MIFKLLLLFIIFVLVKNVFKIVMMQNALKEKMKEAQQNYSNNKNSSQVFDAEYKVIKEDS